MAVWPAQFVPLTGSVQETPPDNNIRSSMDKGPAKVRRRTTANVRPISFRLFVENDDMDTLDDFYTTDTFSGSEPFDFTHPRTGQTVQARFAEPPQYSDVENVGWNATISLEILPS